MPSLLAAPVQRDTGNRLLYLQVEVPAAWHEPVSRHHRHLIELASAMSSVGLSESFITAQLETAIASYREALIDAIRTNGEPSHEG